MTQNRVKKNTSLTKLLAFVMLAAVLLAPAASFAAGLQLLNLPAPTVNRFTPPTDLVWPANVGDADVCLWPDDKWGAFSITIDDNIAYQHQWWMTMGNQYNFRATWFIITSWLAEYGGGAVGGDWAAFNTLYNAGHDVQSHSVNHHGDDDTRPDAEVIYEYAESKNLIETNIPGSQCVALAYPNARGREDLAANYYISARGGTAVPNRVYRINYMKTNSGSAGFRAQIDAILTGTSSVSWIDSRYLRGWGCVHYHQVNDTTAAEADLAYMASFSDDLWIGKYADVARYGQERDSAELIVTNNTSSEIAFTLSDDMLDSVFNFPLTVKARIPDTWSAISATQDGDSVDAEIITHDGNTYALVKVVPDQGTVVLAPEGRIPIPAGFPNASNTGIAGAGLTVDDLTPSGAMTITTDGAVIDMLDVSGLLTVQANNVTIKRCRINNAGYYWGIRIMSGYTGTVIEDCLMIGNGSPESINGHNYTARRCDISGNNDGVKIGWNTIIEDCYIHDQLIEEGTHNDCIQAMSGENIIIRRNTLQAPYQDQNAAIILKTDSGIIDNVLIEDNFLSGGGYTVFLRDGGNGVPTNASLLYNTFEKDSYAFGILSVNGTPTYEGNIYHTGEFIPQNPPVNIDPVADAGTNQTVTDSDDSGAETITLDGSASSDSDGTIASYVWTEDATQIATGETASVSLSVGTHTIELTVTDNDGSTDTDTVVVTVEPAPTIGTTYTITGNGADQAVRNDGTMQYSGQADARIGGVVGTLDGVFVMVFELPALQAGEIVTSANLDFTLLSYSYFHPGCDADLYGLDYRNSSAVLVSDYYQGSYNGDTNATALQAGVMLDNEPTGPVSTDTTGQENLASFIAAQYAAGAQGGDFIFLRINSDIADVTDGRYWSVATANNSTAANRPVLTIVTGTPNEAPVADAGADQTVNDSDDSGSEIVTLDGSTSSDSDGTIASFVWEEDSVQIATGETPSVNLAVGTHTISLTVTDDDGDSHTDSVVITVEEAPEPGSTYTINCNGADQEVRSNGALQYAGQSTSRIGSGGSGYDSAHVLVFELPALAAGENIISSSLDFTLLSYSYWHPGCNADLYGLDYRTSSAVQASDYYQGSYNGDSAATALQDDIMLDNEPTGAISTDTTGEINLAAYITAQYAAGAQGGDFIFLRINPDIADVIDGRYWSIATANNSTVTNRPVLTIVTGAANEAPTANAGADQSVTDANDSGDETVTLDGSASSDSDGSITSYIWEEDSTRIATGETANVDLSVGTHTITLTVTDDDGDTDTDTVIITVDPAPTVETTYTINGSGADQEVRSNGALQYVGQSEGRIGSGGSGYDSAFVLVFELPALDAGETVISATLDFTLLSYSYWHPGCNADLYGLDYRTSSAVLTSDYYQGSYDGDSSAYALQDDIMLDNEPTGLISADSTGQANIASYIEAQYASGAQGGDFIFLRLNPDITNVTDGRYWAVASANNSTVSNRPVLTFTTSAVVQSEEIIAGDTDGDDDVDIFDFLTLKSNFGTTSDATWDMGDFDSDGDVDVFDFLILKSNYGK